jgi:hypothetical protein
VSFLHLHACVHSSTQYLSHIHPPIPFTHLLLPPTGSNASPPTYSALCSPIL